jgi:hypothetical protein
MDDRERFMEAYAGVSPSSGAVPDTSYNGWTNRATWAIALWLDNDEPLYRAMQAYARDMDRRLAIITGERVKAWFATITLPAAVSARAEAFGHGDVNWQEIADDCVKASVA